MGQRKKYSTEEEKKEAHKAALKRAYQKYYEKVKNNPDKYNATYAKNNKKRNEKVMNDPILKEQKKTLIHDWQQRNPEKIREYHRKYYIKTRTANFEYKGYKKKDIKE